MTVRFETDPHQDRWRSGARGGGLAGTADFTRAYASPVSCVQSRQRWSSKRTYRVGTVPLIRVVRSLDLGHSLAEPAWRPMLRRLRQVGVGRRRGDGGKGARTSSIAAGGCPGSDEAESAASATKATPLDVRRHARTHGHTLVPFPPMDRGQYASGRWLGFSG